MMHNKNEPGKAVSRWRILLATGITAFVAMGGGAALLSKPASW